jgi:hypothetical protein
MADASLIQHCLGSHPYKGYSFTNLKTDDSNFPLKRNIILSLDNRLIHVDPLVMPGFSCRRLCIINAEE